MGHPTHDLLIAQVSDLHISTPDSANELVFRTRAHLETAVAHLNALPQRPDLVLITGDLVERGGLDEYARLRACLDGLAMPFYVIPGNHDDRANLLTAFADHAYLPRTSAFVHYVVDTWPVRLIGLDTTVPGQPGGRMCEARLAWLDAQLALAPDRPTVVFMHHPPFATGMRLIDEMGLDGNAAFAAVVRRHPQVEQIVCGHVHRPITTRFAGTVATTCPSTAHQLALDLGAERRLALVMERPACRLLVWSAATRTLVSHLSPIGVGPPPFPIFDGERWLTDAVPPPDFHSR